MEEITIKKIEEAIEAIYNEHPEYQTSITWHYTGMYNKQKEPLFLVNIGSKGHPAFIGGTKKQIEERISRFYKHLLEQT